MGFICAQGAQFSVKKYSSVGLSCASSMGGGAEDDEPHAWVMTAADDTIKSKRQVLRFITDLCSCNNCGRDNVISGIAMVNTY
jgi:hypothetical protein